MSNNPLNNLPQPELPKEQSLSLESKDSPKLNLIEKSPQKTVDVASRQESQLANQSKYENYHEHVKDYIHVRAQLRAQLSLSRSRSEQRGLVKRLSAHDEDFIKHRDGLITDEFQKFLESNGSQRTKELDYLVGSYQAECYQRELQKVKAEQMKEEAAQRELYEKDIARLAESVQAKWKEAGVTGAHWKKGDDKGGKGSSELTEELMKKADKYLDEELDKLLSKYEKHIDNKDNLRIHLKSQISESRVDAVYQGKQAWEKALKDAESLYKWGYGVTGTYEKEIHECLEGMSKEEKALASKAYRLTYKRDLEQDLRDEFSGCDLKRFEAGWSCDPATSDGRVTQRAHALYWAMRAHTGWMTDEDMIYKALDGLTKEEIGKLKDEYIKVVKANEPGTKEAMNSGLLVRHLKSELGGADLDRAMSLLEGSAVRADAAKIHYTMKGGITGWGADAKVLCDTIRYKTTRDEYGHEKQVLRTQKEIYELVKAYRKMYGESLDSHMKGELGRAHLAQARALLKCDYLAADAAELEYCMHGNGWWTSGGTSEDRMREIIKDPDPTSPDAVLRYEREIETFINELGNEEVRKDAEGNPVYKVDKDGNPVFERDAEDNLILKQISYLDERGQRVTADNYRQALEGTYSKDWKVINGGSDLRSAMQADMKGLFEREIDLKSCLAMLDDGKISDSLKMRLHIDGLGTDNEGGKDVLRGKSKAQIIEFANEYEKERNTKAYQEFLEEYRKEHNGSEPPEGGGPIKSIEDVSKKSLLYEHLVGAVISEFSGDDGFDVTDMLLGDINGIDVPPEEKIDRIEKRMKWEGGESISTPLLIALSPGLGIAKLMSDRTTDHDRNVMMEQSNRAIEALKDQIARREKYFQSAEGRALLQKQKNGTLTATEKIYVMQGRLSPTEMAGVSVAVSNSVNSAMSYRQTRNAYIDTVVNYTAMAAAIVFSIAATAGTFGTLSFTMVAAGAFCVSLATRMALKVAMKGDLGGKYGLEEIFGDFGNATIDGVSFYAGARLGALAAKSAALTGINRGFVEGAVRAALADKSLNVSSKVFQRLVNQEILRQARLKGVSMVSRNLFTGTAEAITDGAVGGALSGAMIDAKTQIEIGTEFDFGRVAQSGVTGGIFGATIGGLAGSTLHIGGEKFAALRGTDALSRFGAKHKIRELRKLAEAADAPVSGAQAASRGSTGDASFYDLPGTTPSPVRNGTGATTTSSSTSTTSSSASTNGTTASTTTSSTSKAAQKSASGRADALDAQRAQQEAQRKAQQELQDKVTKAQQKADSQWQQNPSQQQQAGPAGSSPRPGDMIRNVDLSDPAACKQAARQLTGAAKDSSKLSGAVGDLWIPKQVWKELEKDTRDAILKVQKKAKSANKLLRGMKIDPDDYPADHWSREMVNKSFSDGWTTLCKQKDLDFKLLNNLLANKELRDRVFNQFAGRSLSRHIDALARLGKVTRDANLDQLIKDLSEAGDLYAAQQVLNRTKGLSYDLQLALARTDPPKKGGVPFPPKFNRAKYADMLFERAELRAGDDLFHRLSSELGEANLPAWTKDLRGANRGRTLDIIAAAEAVDPTIKAEIDIHFLRQIDDVRDAFQYGMMGAKLDRVIIKGLRDANDKASVKAVLAPLPATQQKSALAYVLATSLNDFKSAKLISMLEDSIRDEVAKFVAQPIRRAAYQLAKDGADVSNIAQQLVKRRRLDLVELATKDSDGVPFRQVKKTGRNADHNDFEPLLPSKKADATSPVIRHPDGADAISKAKKDGFLVMMTDSNGLRGGCSLDKSARTIVIDSKTTLADFEAVLARTKHFKEVTSSTGASVGKRVFGPTSGEDLAKKLTKQIDGVDEEIAKCKQIEGRRALTAEVRAKAKEKRVTLEKSAKTYSSDEITRAKAIIDSEIAQLGRNLTPTEMADAMKKYHPSHPHMKLLASSSKKADIVECNARRRVFQALEGDVRSIRREKTIFSGVVREKLPTSGKISRMAEFAEARLLNHPNQLATYKALQEICVEGGEFQKALKADVHLQDIAKKHGEAAALAEWIANGNLAKWVRDNGWPRTSLIERAPVGEIDKALIRSLRDCDNPSLARTIELRRAGVEFDHIERILASEAKIDALHVRKYLDDVKEAVGLPTKFRTADDYAKAGVLEKLRRKIVSRNIDLLGAYAPETSAHAMTQSQARGRWLRTYCRMLKDLGGDKVAARQGLFRAMEAERILRMDNKTLRRLRQHTVKALSETTDPARREILNNRLFVLNVARGKMVTRDAVGAYHHSFGKIKTPFGEMNISAKNGVRVLCVAGAVVLAYQSYQYIMLAILFEKARHNQMSVFEFGDNKLWDIHSEEGKRFQEMFNHFTRYLPGAITAEDVSKNLPIDWSLYDLDYNTGQWEDFLGDLSVLANDLDIIDRMYSAGRLDTFTYAGGLDKLAAATPSATSPLAFATLDERKDYFVSLADKNEEELDDLEKKRRKDSLFQSS